MSAAAVLAALALLGGVACSSAPVELAPATIPPASPARAPAPAHAPAGTVRPLDAPAQAAVFDPGADALVVLSPGADASAPATLTVFDTAAGPGRVIELPGRATALARDEDRLYLSTRGGYFVVDPTAPDGAVRRVAVREHADTVFTALDRRADGRMVLGSADGAVVILAATDGPEADVGDYRKIFARVDSIVTEGDTAMVLDRGQTSVTALDANAEVAQALRAGEGATTMVADPAGRILVADTRGGALLVFSANPLILRQRYPVASAPYGLAGSSELAWVSQTAANTVVGYDLSTGIPVEKVRYPTVQQPNSLAFDDATDTLYVVSGSGAGVQVIRDATGSP
ncbi:YncE family protein [Mycolicibacterium sp.]|uniref:YncE family protein n=1 Tax=Mycolicibacterium sp. TaxID=2320850 RepID=UPI0035675F57